MTEKSAPAALWHHYDSLAHQQETTALGMWVFLATEVLIFGAMFTGYTVYRIQFLPSFEAVSRHLNLLIGGINTLVLLTSSLTMALGVRAAQLGRSKNTTLYLLLTAALGSLFMILKATEYYLDYRENLVPLLAFNPSEWTDGGARPQQVQLFLIFYYCLTGLHAIHLTIGITIVLVLAVLAHQRHFTGGYYSPVETWGLYWHFVDVIWIFLLPLLYLVGTRMSLW